MARTASRRPSRPAPSKSRRKAAPPVVRASDLLDRAAWYAVLATAFLSLVAWGPSSGDVFVLAKFTVLTVGTAVAAALGAIACIAGQVRLPRSRLAIPAAVLLGVMAIASAASMSPGWSWMGRTGRFASFATWLAVVVLGALVAVLAARSTARLRELAAVLGAAATIDAAAVIVSLAGPRIGTTSSAQGGLMGNANFAGAHLGLSLPVMWFLVRDAVGPRVRVVWPVASAVVVAGLVAAFSLGGFYAALAGIAVLMWCWVDAFPRWLPRVLLAASALVLAVVLLGATARSFSWAEPLDHVPVVSSDRVQSRADLWRAGVHVVGEHPLLGTGPDTFALVFAPARQDQPPGYPDYEDEPHNNLLQLTVGSGVVAGGAFVAVLVLAFVYAGRARTVLRDEDDEERDVGTGGSAPGRAGRLGLLSAFAGSLAGYAAQGLTSIDGPALLTCAWVSIGALAALADPAIVASRRRWADETGAGVAPPTRAPAVVAAAAVPIVVVTLVVVSTVVRPFRGEQLIGEGQRRMGLVASGAVSTGAVRSSFDAAIEADPWNADRRDTVGEAERELADLPNRPEDGTRKEELYAAARVRLDEALAMAPGSIQARLDLARLLRQQAVVVGTPAYEEADAIYAGLIADDPGNPRFPLDRAWLLATWFVQTNDARRREQALASFDDAVRLGYAWPVGLEEAAAGFERLGETDKAIAAYEASLAHDPTRVSAKQAITRLRKSG